MYAKTRRWVEMAGTFKKNIFYKLFYISYNIVRFKTINSNILTSEKNTNFMKSLKILILINNFYILKNIPSIPYRKEGWDSSKITYII